MGAPTVTTIRSGVTFTSAAAASFRRAERAWGRRIDVNSTYRDWNKQWSMYTAWNAYVAGRGPRPSHSRAIHPDMSKHCQALALDSDDWTRPGFNKLMSEHGWIRTAANDPTERHHFEYQSWRDRHVGEFAGDDITPLTPEDEEPENDMRIIYNTENSEEATRRALVGEHTFKIITPTEATALNHSGLITHNVTAAEWVAVLIDVVENRARLAQSLGMTRRLLYNTANPNDGTRRAVVGPGVFRVVTADESTGERRVWGAPTNVNQAQWDAERAAALTPAATPIPNAGPSAEVIAAEVIRQMKLPGN